MSSSDSIISGLTSFPTVATWVSCVPLLLMMAFMGTCKDIAKTDFSEQISLKGQGMTGETGGFVAHIFFMTGARPPHPRPLPRPNAAAAARATRAQSRAAPSCTGVIGAGWGFVTLGNALGYPPELSGCAGLSAFAGTLIYMTIAGQCITGMPRFNAPIDVRVLFITPCIVLTVNMLLEALEGNTSLGFWIYYLAAIGVPQLMGAKNRADGWMTPVLKP